MIRNLLREFIESKSFEARALRVRSIVNLARPCARGKVTKEARILQIAVQLYGLVTSGVVQDYVHELFPVR